jgi:hypothetical protein
MMSIRIDAGLLMLAESIASCSSEARGCVNRVSTLEVTDMKMTQAPSPWELYTVEVPDARRYMGSCTTKILADKKTSA